ncbi:VOC family protein [Streptomyces sp. C10-9-1]|uniref:VOC family protein n=1 Tax=Streptomyces sp. C10-9-1 TaxID=1859285 RepID=UPI003D723CBE
MKHRAKRPLSSSVTRLPSPAKWRRRIRLPSVRPRSCAVGTWAGRPDPCDSRSGAGLGRRILFQRVPEEKTGKNRLHIDLHTAPGEREAETARLVVLGAAVLEHRSEEDVAVRWRWRMKTAPFVDERDGTFRKAVP